MHEFQCNILKKRANGQRDTGRTQADRHRHNLSIPYVKGGTLLFSASSKYAKLYMTKRKIIDSDISIFVLLTNYFVALYELVGQTNISKINT